MAQSIHVNGVSKSYELRGDGGSLPVLNQVSFTVDAGQFVAVVGPSGCGKTTLLNLMDGQGKPSTGAIQIGGKRIDEPMANVAVVFQNFELLPWRTVLENAWLGLEIRKLDKKERRARTLEWVAAVGLSGFEDRYPHELSGGMQQRVGLARALVVDPEVLLMDEPFGALDAMTRDQMQRELLRLLERRKKTVVFITHDIKEAIFLADRVLVMSQRPGEVILDLDIPLEGPRWKRRMAVENDERFSHAEATIREELGLEETSEVVR